MIPVQYRDPQTEEILERRYEEGAPAIGTRVRIGFRRVQGPLQVALRAHLVHRVRAQGCQGESSGGPGLRLEAGSGSERPGTWLARVASLWKL